MPVLSVITGAYNAAACPHFKESLMSVLNQSLSDFEFIICDDGSTDNTYEILCRFAALDTRIKLLKNKKNEGLAKSLNQCLAVSSGKYIARHDCDDYSERERFQKQITYLEANPHTDILGTAITLFDERGTHGIITFPARVKNRDFLFSTPYQHGAVIFRRSAILRAGGYRIAKETRRCEDYDLFMRMQLFCSGENLIDPLYRFCENEDTRKRRKYRFRIDEARVRARGFCALGLMPWALPFVLKPLLVGMLPKRLLLRLQKKHRAAKHRSGGGGRT